MRRLSIVLIAGLLAGCRPLFLLPDLAAEPFPFVSEIAPVTADDVSHSWRSGCPVPLESLRLVSVDYWGFDDQPHRGDLVLNVEHAEAVAGVMETLYKARFPIERIEPVDAFLGDDDASMAANNTSAFNCREVSRRPGVWSQHAFGTAIDINPLQNPYILRDGTVLPAGAVTDRASAEPGMIHPDGVVVEAFATIGWGWGGNWTSGVLDYQHFSASGR